MLAATDRPAFRKGFGPMPEGFDHFLRQHECAARRLVSDAESETPRIAAVMVESVQGEGGAKQLPKGFLPICASFVSRAAAVADEVQIGVPVRAYLLF